MEEFFQNNTIMANQLPKVEAINYTSLSSKYKKVIWLRSLFFLIIIIGISGSPLFLKVFNSELNWSMNQYVAVFVLGVIIALYQMIISVCGFSKKGYVIREHDLIYKSGLINKKITVIPFNRVQHISLLEGMLLRVFGLSKLQFYTAGGSLADLIIPGISKEEAEKIKAFVLHNIDDEKENLASINPISKIEQENKSDEF